MATLKQIEANRRNSQKSTGPRTEEGKSVVRLNALKSGIDAKAEVVLPCENAEDLAALAVSYYDEFQPSTPQERCLVDSLVSDDWLLRRFRRIHAQTFTKQIGDLYRPEKNALLGQANTGCERRIERAQRRVDAIRKSYEKTLAVLNKLRAARPSDPEGPPAAPPAPISAGDFSEQTQSGPQLVESPESPSAASADRQAGAPLQSACFGFRRPGVRALPSPVPFPRRITA